MGNFGEKKMAIFDPSPDGRPSPPWRGQLRRIRENRELVVSAQFRPV